MNRHRLSAAVLLAAALLFLGSCTPRHTWQGPPPPGSSAMAFLVDTVHHSGMAPASPAFEGHADVLYVHFLTDSVNAITDFPEEWHLHANRPGRAIGFTGLPPVGSRTPDWERQRNHPRFVVGFWTVQFDRLAPDDDRIEASVVEGRVPAGESASVDIPLLPLKPEPAREEERAPERRPRRSRQELLEREREVRERESKPGPDAGGVLFFHANPELSVARGRQYRGTSGLPSCAAAVDSIPADGMHIVHVLAAFPTGSSPRLGGIAFGVSYDPAKVGIANWGSCGDFELSMKDWPASGTGTSVVWDSAQTGQVVEIYWFAAYSYEHGIGTLSLGPYPAIQGGVFASYESDWPSRLDRIADYGRLGIGLKGYTPCP